MDTITIFKNALPSHPATRAVPGADARGSFVLSKAVNDAILHFQSDAEIKVMVGPDDRCDVLYLKITPQTGPLSGGCFYAWLILDVNSSHFTGAKDDSDLLFPSSKPIFGCLTPTGVFRSGGEGESASDAVIEDKDWIVMGQGAVNVCMYGYAGPNHFSQWNAALQSNRQTEVDIHSTTNHSGAVPKVHHTAILRHGAELTILIRQICVPLLHPEMESGGRMGWAPRSHMTPEHLSIKANASHAFNKKWLSEVACIFDDHSESADTDTGWWCRHCWTYSGTNADVLDHEQRCSAVSSKKRRMLTYFGTV